MGLLEFLINNTYITVLDKCFHQNIGIPMGTNAGVNIVDFYLTKYELDFMVQLKSLQKWDLLTKFSNTMRYLDDIFSIDNVTFSQLLYTDMVMDGVTGIYPRNAVTRQLGERGESVTYMDTMILKEHHEVKGDNVHDILYTRTYDKRFGPKYKNLHIIKYPTSDSLLYNSVSYNIVLTQCHRFIILDMRKEDFIRDTSQVIRELTRKGFNQEMLLAKAKRFLLTYRTKLIYGSHPLCLFKDLKTSLR